MGFGVLCDLALCVKLFPDHDPSHAKTPSRKGTIRTEQIFRRDFGKEVALWCIAEGLEFVAGKRLCRESVDELSPLEELSDQE